MRDPIEHMRRFLCVSEPHDDVLKGVSLREDKQRDHFRLPQLDCDGNKAIHVLKLKKELNHSGGSVSSLESVPLTHHIMMIVSLKAFLYNHDHVVIPLQTVFVAPSW